MKKVWSKPTLVVLVRGNPAETCIICCKQSGSEQSAGIGAQGCDYVPTVLVPGLVACVACNEVECS